MGTDIVVCWSQKGEVVLAKVDCTQKAELLQKFDIKGFPTLFLFVEGVHKACEGKRTKDGIVTWVKKKTRHGVYNITTSEETILATEATVVLGFIDSLVGPESEEIVAASRLQDDVNIEALDKRPALVLLKKEDEKLSYFDGPFSNSAIAEFVSNNKLPFIVTYNRESAMLMYDNPIKKQLLLFATSHDSDTIKPTFLDAAKSFKGRLAFVYVEMDNQDNGKQVLDYYGVLAFRTDDDNKYLMDGNLTLSNMKSFTNDFLEDRLRPFYKSDPIPEKNDGDVKLVVGKNFDEVVLDESKDVLLEALEPIYDRLGKHLRGIDSLVIAKMDQ
ncbi:protein disulfide isomerase-like 1-3 [Durio zibethinus]|uniref:Protein disulfide isomerase-like 1-3 n=1 Tax=Durio zibethinus TaxID=66656 RepID=A0A6P5Z628_DURZI|nr:protein disulfide isomerase-like 1-3 [Durio zibethinus]